MCCTLQYDLSAERKDVPQYFATTVGSVVKAACTRQAKITEGGPLDSGLRHDSSEPQHSRIASG